MNGQISHTSSAVNHTSVATAEQTFYVKGAKDLYRTQAGISIGSSRQAYFLTSYLKGSLDRPFCITCSKYSHVSKDSTGRYYNEQV